MTQIAQIVMKYDELNLKKIREVPIFDVCSKLGISLYGMGKKTKRTTCWYHDDQHPSMHVNKVKNIYKCFVCGKGGDVIKLVQDYENKSFVEACDWLVKEFDIVIVPDAPVKTNTNLTHQTNHSCDSSDSCSENKSVSLDASLVTKSQSVNSVFCKAVVSAGYLSQGQMMAAANRYRLGASKEGGVIFWEIDDQERVHTGKIMYYQPDCHRDKDHNPTWVHSLMQSQLPANYELQHCLFGLHLLNNHPDPLMVRGYLNNVSFSSFLRAEEKDRSGNKGVAIVESEKTAVIMSEMIPEFVWLSCGGLQMFKPELLAPLVNHKVVIFPDTDETGEAYNTWLAVLQQAQRQYTFKYPLRISPLLELHATLDQKSRKIDLIDYLFEGEPSNNKN